MLKHLKTFWEGFQSLSLGIVFGTVIFVFVAVLLSPFFVMSYLGFWPWVFYMVFWTIALSYWIGCKQ